MPSCPAKGEVLTPKTIEIVGSSTWSGGSGLRVARGGDGVADLDVLDARERDDVAAAARVGLDALQAVEHVELRDLAGRRAGRRACETATVSPTATVPATTRPIASRPT